MAEDSELLELFVKRSENVLSMTAEKYGKYCHSIAYGILGDHDDSEECVNDTLMNAWNSIPPHMPQKLSCFLGKITRNLALNIYDKKHAARRGSGQTAAALDELAECADMNSTIETEEEKTQIREVINNFLREQSDVRRNIFIQRYWYMLSIKEVAFQQEMKSSQVKSVLYQMRVELKKRLEKEGLF